MKQHPLDWTKEDVDTLPLVEKIPHPNRKRVRKLFKLPPKVKRYPEHVRD